MISNTKENTQLNIYGTFMSLPIYIINEIPVFYKQDVCKFLNINGDDRLLCNIIKEDDANTVLLDPSSVEVLAIIARTDYNSIKGKSLRMLTSDCVIEYLCRSTNEIAKQFKKQLKAYINQLRINRETEIKLSLEESKKTLEIKDKALEIKEKALEESKRIIQEKDKLIAMKQEIIEGTLYEIYDNRTNKLLYIGKHNDEKKEKRFNDHMIERQNIIDNHTKLAIHLATIPEVNITAKYTTIFYKHVKELDEAELKRIKIRKPICNEAGMPKTDDMKLTCDYCDKTLASYKNLKRHNDVCTKNKTHEKLPGPVHISNNNIITAYDQEKNNKIQEFMERMKQKKIRAIFNAMKPINKIESDVDSDNDNE